MRIVHVTDSFAPRVGGIERQVEALARQQRASGHDVTVVTSVPGDPYPELPVVRPSMPRWQVFGSPLRLRRFILRGLAGDHSDSVIHAHLSVVSPLAARTALVASRRGIPTALTVHSLWPRSVMAFRVANMPYWDAPIRGAWSAVSTVAADDVARVLPGAAPVLVVPNLVYTDWWRRPLPSLRAVPDELGVVAVGRLTGRKRIGALLEILARVRRELDPGTRLRATIVGDGPQRAGLARRIDRDGMSGWVHLVGQRSPEAIRALLHRSDVFVAPSLRESFGIAALEARSAGVPVVGFRASGLADFIADGRDGVLVDSDQAMATALVELAENPNALRRLHDEAASQEPSLGAAGALQAVGDLYDRARRAARGRTSPPVPAPPRPEAVSAGQPP